MLQRTWCDTAAAGGGAAGMHKRHMIIAQSVIIAR